MKKFVLISLVLFIISFMCFAEEVYPSEGVYPGAFRNPDGITLKEGDKVNIGVDITCEIDNLPSFVTIGFVNNIPENFDFNTEFPSNSNISILDLNDFDGDGKGNNAENSAYVFYQIKSQMGLTVSLGLTDLLKSQNDELGWTVSWSTPGTTDNVQYSSGDISYRENAVNETHVSPIYFQAVNAGGTVAGYKELTVQTEDYRGKPVDTYVGYIYVNIAADGV